MSADEDEVTAAAAARLERDRLLRDQVRELLAAVDFVPGVVHNGSARVLGTRAEFAVVAVLRAIRPQNRGVTGDYVTIRRLREVADRIASWEVT